MVAKARKPAMISKSRASSNLPREPASSGPQRHDGNHQENEQADRLLRQGRRRRIEAAEDGLAAAGGTKMGGGKAAGGKRGC